MRLVLVLVLSIGFASFLSAQNNKSLKGPKAKNQKSWDSPSKKVAVYVVMQNHDVKGPERKNQKFWTIPLLQPNPVVLADRKRYNGPLAKNYKPWKHGRKMVQPVRYSQGR